MGETLATKILRNLRAARTVPLARFVAGFNIEGVGTVIMDKVVAAGYDTLEKLEHAAAEELAEVPGIGPVLGETIARGVSELAPRMRAVIETGCVTPSAPSGGPLQGLSFCFTGTLSSMPRSKAQDLVRESGGTVTGSVTKGLSYLVTNDPDSGSSKNAKAAKLGVRIIDEAAFLAILDGGDRTPGTSGEESD
jgi:DNA ligase (NAD+)